MPRAREKLLTELGLAMREVSGLGVLHSEAMASRLGISSTDLECLDLISTGQAITPTELATRTGLTTGAITGVLDRLESIGFVQRVRATDDRRKVYLKTTGKAAKIADPLGEGMARLVASAMDQYKSSELELVLRFLADMTSAAREAIALLRQQPARHRAKVRKDLR